ncbi:MAG: antitoxin [Verrucomicrobiales bacterium]
MRTTLTIDPEVADRLKQEAALGKRPLKVIVNEALRRGLGLAAAKRPKPYRVKPHSSAFLPGIDSGKLNQLVDEIEAGEFLAKQGPRP